MIPPDESFEEAAYLAANPDVAKAVRTGQFKSGWDHYRLHGKTEGRPGRPPIVVLPRVTKALELLDRKGQGLEIGPSHNPIAPKRQGYNVHILDHATAAELRAKYAGHEAFGVQVENIEEVDFVWRGQPLTELIGKSACYDWIIASHVIEHLPDLITFLQQAEALLKPEGKLSLIIPDRRYCFDFFGRESSTGDLLDALADRRTRPTPGKVFDHIANSVRRNGTIAWSAATSEQPVELMHTFAQAMEHWNAARGTTDYLDVHCWRFTPESFRLIVSDLQHLGLLGLTVSLEHPTEGCEFYVTLGKGKPAGPTDRLAALLAVKAAG